MPANKLFVGSLSFSTTDQGLADAFAQAGTVVSAKVIMDRDSGRSKGFGFVEMESGAEAAISSLNGQEIDGRSLTVNEARPKEDRGGSRGGSRGGFSGGRERAGSGGGRRY